MRGRARRFRGYQKPQVAGGPNYAEKQHATEEPDHTGERYTDSEPDYAEKRSTDADAAAGHLP